MAKDTKFYPADFRLDVIRGWREWDDKLERALRLSVEHYFKAFDCCDICPLGAIDCDNEHGEMIYPDTYGVKCAGGDVKECQAALVEYWKRKAADDDDD